MTIPLEYSLDQLKDIVSAYIESISDDIAERIVEQIRMQGICANASDEERNEGRDVIIRFTVPSTEECEMISEEE